MRLRNIPGADQIIAGKSLCDTRAGKKRKGPGSRFLETAIPYTLRWGWERENSSQRWQNCTRTLTMWELSGTPVCC